MNKSTVGIFSIERAFQNTDTNIFISPKTAQMSVEIYNTVGTRVFQDVPVSIMANYNRHYKETLFSSAVNITLGGSSSALDSLRVNQIRAFVDVSGVNGPGIYDMKVDC